MDVQRFEAIAYAQAARGVGFVQVAFVDRFETQMAQGAVRGSSPAPRLYTYKVPKDLLLALNDLVLVQVFNQDFAVAQVTKVLEEPPQIDEYDYSKPLKWVLQKVDRARSEQLAESDRLVLKALSQVSLKARIAQLGQALGVDIMQVASQADVLEAPKEV